MIVIDNFLKPAVLNEILSVMKSADYIDGRATAGRIARLVKKNEQLSPKAARPLIQLLSRSVFASESLTIYSWPKFAHHILFSRYRKGSEYGRHMDSTFMGEYRCDISFTLFLSPPQHYKGGELVLWESDKEKVIKPNQNTLVAYQSNMLHRVNPVQHGERLAAVGWIQSHIKEHHHRSIVSDIQDIKTRLFNEYGKTPEVDEISRIQAQLKHCFYG